MSFEVGIGAAEALRSASSYGLLAACAAVAAGAAALVLRGRRPRLESALWGLVLLRLAIPVGLGHPWSLSALTSRLSLAAAAHLQVRAAGGSETGSPAGRSPDRSDIGQERALWPLAGVALWMAASITAALVLRRRSAPYRRVLHAAEPLSDPRALRLARSWQDRLGVRRRVDWKVSEKHVVPFTMGCLRPVVVLPRKMLDCASDTGLEAAVAHELVHVRRWDALRHRFDQLVLVAWVLHPVAWVAVWRRARLREQICDRGVVTAGMEARGYARGLLEAITHALESAVAPALLGGSHRKEILMTRIDSLLSFRPARLAGSLAGVATVVLVALFVLPTAGGGAPASAPLVPGDGPEVPVLGHPLPGARVTAGFGPLRDPWTGEATAHRGIDLAAPRGTGVLAPADGVVAVAVVEAGDDSRGRWLVIEHDGPWSTVFTHLEEILVEPGETVLRGQTVARVGSTGRSTGPHLHFELRRSGEPVDPARLVTGL